MPDSWVPKKTPIVIIHSKNKKNLIHFLIHYFFSWNFLIISMVILLDNSSKV